MTTVPAVTMTTSARSSTTILAGGHLGALTRIRLEFDRNIGIAEGQQRPGRRLGLQRDTAMRLAAKQQLLTPPRPARNISFHGAINVYFVNDIDDVTAHAYADIRVGKDPGSTPCCDLRGYRLVIGRGRSPCDGPRDRTCVWAAAYLRQRRSRRSQPFLGTASLFWLLMIIT